MTAKRLMAFVERSSHLANDVANAAPEEHRNNSLCPEDDVAVLLEEGLNGPLHERIALYWRVFVGYSLRLNTHLEELATLACERARMPDPFDPAQDPAAEDDK
jgi:hypothetical protein